MNYHRRVLITLFSLVSLLVATLASPPPPAGSCGVDGPFCEEGFCCSKWGWCGNTSDYCDREHCLSQCPFSPPPPPPPTGSCGVDGPFCPEGFCCSKWGWCGNTPDYCDPEHCQSQCPSPTPPRPSTSPPPPYPLGPIPPREDINSLITSSPPPAGSCGVDGPFCQEGFCCSKWGWCGNTSNYCDPENCQSQCPSSPPPPVGSCGVDGPFCQEGFCCSKWGWCGNTPDYCDPEHCQSQCPSSTPPPPSISPPPSPLGPTPPSEDISSLITSSLFEEMLLHRNDVACPARGFYTYDAFITAAKSFPAFATTGDTDTRKRELAAFFAQTSHETTGGWATAPDGPYAWGYCFLEEIGGGDYCVPVPQWPCVPGKQYYGRGPIQLSYNYNYGPCGEALGVDLLSNPDLVASDTIISFKSALWFWMTPQPPKPSCHDVITQNWTPSPADNAANRLPGYGVTTNIINGGLECGHGGPDPRVESRIGFYKRYCELFGVSYGDNLDCYNQAPFGWGLLLDTM